MERDKTQAGIGVMVGIIMAVVLVMVAITSFALGEEAILTSCEKTSFFYVHQHVYECMLVHKELGK